MPDLAADARRLFDAAVRGAQADRLLGGLDLSSLAPRPLPAYRRVVVAGLGKAALAMAGVVEQKGVPIDEGLVVVPRGYAETLPSHLPTPTHTRVMDADHPVPGERSAAAGRALLQLAEGCGAEDLLLALVSGGGTALAALPAEGLSLYDVQQTFQLLLESGADIHALNAVRKHLLQVGGGQLARAAAPAAVCALAVSDVPGDDRSTLASGPTVPDPTTFADALGVLEKTNLRGEVPPAVRSHLEAGEKGERAETPKPGAALFEHVRTRLVGRNRDALEAAKREAEQRGYAVHLTEESVVGEAREVARQHVQALREVASGGSVCLLWGGETTVTVRGSGKGGRNQELALAAALALGSLEHEAALLSGGTDGIDGPTNAAGAVATTRTLREAQAAGLDADAFLENNDAYSFFDRLGGLIKIGPTHTNVMDVQIGLLR